VTGYSRVLSQTLASKISKLINFKGNYFLGFGFQDLMETYNTINWKHNLWSNANLIHYSRKLKLSYRGIIQINSMFIFKNPLKINHLKLTWNKIFNKTVKEIDSSTFLEQFDTMSEFVFYRFSGSSFRKMRPSSPPHEFFYLSTWFPKKEQVFSYLGMQFITILNFTNFNANFLFQQITKFLEKRLKLQIIFNNFYKGFCKASFWNLFKAFLGMGKLIQISEKFFVPFSKDWSFKYLLITKFHKTIRRSRIQKSWQILNGFS
jgi:hypothetical protein